MCKKRRQAYGARQATAKLTDADAIIIRQDTRTQREIATSRGVSQRTVWNIKNEIAWKHL
jgi:DNA invertase Pin-like site-specific DNA recombinase